MFKPNFPFIKYRNSMSLSSLACTIGVVKSCHYPASKTCNEKKVCIKWNSLFQGKRFQVPFSPQSFEWKPFLNQRRCDFSLACNSEPRVKFSETRTKRSYIWTGRTYKKGNFISSNSGNCDELLLVVPFGCIFKRDQNGKSRRSIYRSRRSERDHCNSKAVTTRESTPQTSLFFLSLWHFPSSPSVPLWCFFHFCKIGNKSTGLKKFFSKSLRAKISISNLEFLRPKNWNVVVPKEIL